MTLSQPKARPKQRQQLRRIDNHVPEQMKRNMAVAETPTRTSVFTKGLVLLLVGSAVYRLLLASFVTNFVLVDDAYIHLRYARNLVEGGYFSYNAGEAVFGLTSPLYGLLTSVLYKLFASNVAVAVIAVNVLLWTAAGALLARELPKQTRLPLLGLFLLAPVFVDNQLLGMETPLFVFLLIGAAQSARAGRVLASALWFGPALVTRPEAVLLVPFLLFGVVRYHGVGGAVKRLMQPRSLLALLGPGVAWASFALYTYGSILPQSMLAKSGWNSTHYDGFATLKNALLMVPHLSFLPFIDYFPGPIQWAMTGALFVGIGWVIRCNIQQGTAASRAWLGFYLTYLAFYLLGKGATEASWYAVPSSVALLCAASPALPSWFCHPTRKAPQWALIAGLVLISTAASMKRAPLLRSYVEGYGASAVFLEGYDQTEDALAGKVVIGEIGVFGFLSSHPVVDVGALVSPEVLPWKNEGFSFTRIVQESKARYFVISQRAIELNMYPSVGTVWADDVEHSWFDTRCKQIAQHLDKRVFEVLPEVAVSTR